MSLILDALRKMEQERRSRRGAAQDLRPEVLRYRLAAQPKQSSRYPLLVAGILLVGVGIGAGVLLKGNGPGAVTQGRQETVEVAQAPAPLPAPVAPVAMQPTPAPAASSAAPAEPVAAPVPAVQPVRPEPARERTAPAVQPRPVVAAVPQAVPQQYDSGAGQAEGADITISGIAFQDERRLRRAVVNGVLVGEGAEIAGARITEIKETKVRFSRGGHVFDVPFSSGLHAR